MTVEHIGKYLGQTIEDSMGRPVGKVVGLSVDVKDEVTAIQVVHSDGEFAKHEINCVKVLEDRLILQKAWKVEAETLQRERGLITRRRQAIDLLLKDGDINQSEFDQLKTTYETLDKQIAEKSETMKENLDQVETKLDQQINDLQGALTNVKMLYSSSEISEATYENVTGSIKSSLEIARKERQDLDNLRGGQSNIEPTDAPLFKTIYQTVTGSIRSGFDIGRKERKDIPALKDIEKMDETVDPPIAQPSPEDKDKNTKLEPAKKLPSDVVVIKINEMSHS